MILIICKIIKQIHFGKILLSRLILKISQVGNVELMVQLPIQWDMFNGIILKLQTTS